MLSKHVFWTVSTIARPHSFPNASLKKEEKTFSIEMPVKDKNVDVSKE